MSRFDSSTIDSILESGQFDEAWYRAAYPDVARLPISAVEHFARFGALLGRHGNASAFATHKGRLSSTIATLTVGAGSQPSPVARGRQVKGGATIPLALRERIQSTGLFDEAWYRQRYSALMSHDDALEDYLACLQLDSHRDPGPLFSTAEYLSTHQDVRGIHPFVHFVEHGLKEGRAAFSCQKVNDYLDRANLNDVASLDQLLDKAKRSIVLHWSDGNFFFSEIAEYTARYLSEVGFTSVCYDDYPLEHLKDCNVIVVAPHEFCVYGPGKDWPEETLSQAVYLNTEQWHTSWFALTYRYVRASQKALDINPSSAAGLARLGATCGFIPLLPLEGSGFAHPQAPLDPRLTDHKFVRPLTFPDSLLQRPYDVLFLATLNERRQQALAFLAPQLSEHECFLHAPKFDRPVRATDPDMVSNADFAQLARNSKILLNIHQGKSRYFEWHRLFLSGMMEGCVVLTEPCAPIGLVRPNEHYIECSLEDMPGALDHYLNSREGQAELEGISANCRALRDRIAAGERFLRT
jgi:hypothetical protein